MVKGVNPLSLNMDHPFIINEHDIKIVHNSADDSVTLHFVDTPIMDSKNMLYFTQTLYVNQTIVTQCHAKNNNAYLGVSKYYGTKIVDGKLEYQFWYFRVDTKKAMPCVYPDFIIYSVDLLQPPTFPNMNK